MLGETSGLQIAMAGDFVVKADWVLGPRRNPDYELVYFPAGNGTTYTASDRVFLLSQPCLIVTRPLEEHTYHFDKLRTTRHLFFHFTAATPDHGHPFPTILSAQGPSMIPLGDASIVPTLLKQTIAISTRKEAEWQLRSKLLFGAALGELEGMAANSAARSPHTVPQPIVRALDCMNDPGRLPSLTVAEIAALTGWTYEHFCRMFKRHVGLSPREALLDRRLEYAGRLLVQDTRSVKEVAHAVGLADEHYFSRIFNRRQGMPPSQYRLKFASLRNRHLAPADDSLAAYPLNRYVYFD